MIDWDRVSELREEMGDEEFTPVLELFLDEVEATIMRLHSADPEKFEADLHFLRGSAGNLGFRSLSALCREGENLAKDARLADFDEGRIADCYSYSKAALLRGLAWQRATA